MPAAALVFEQAALRRLGKPLEVAYGVPILALNETGFVAGAKLVIGGGLIAI